MNPPDDPPEVNVNGQTTTIEKPQTSAAIAAKSSASKQAAQYKCVQSHLCIDGGQNIENKTLRI